MVDIKLGDYVIGRQKDLYRVVQIVNDVTGTYYDVRSINRINDLHPYPVVQGLTHSQLRHLGEIIPVEKIGPALKILFSS